MKISKRVDRKKCGNKRKYNTIEEAQKAAAIFAKKKKIITMMRAYGCHCGKFHFGKTKQIDWRRVTVLDMSGQIDAVGEES